MRAPAWVMLGVAAVAAVASACSAPAPPPTVLAPGSSSAAANAAATQATHTTAMPAAVLPSSSPALGPAQSTVDGALDGATLTESESCAGCHAQAAAEWRSSPHAFGSFNNPVYRVVVDRFRADVGKDASRFCGGCHDVALLVDGAMSGEVAPADPRAHGGITCRVCHGIESARPDGNGSYTLASSPIPIPRDGDEASVREHKARMVLAPLRTAQMCGACHRAFLSPETGNPAHLVGQDELGAWQRSAYAGSAAARIDDPIAPAECRTCHMPLVDAPLGDAAARDGKIRSHRFAGGNTWLAAMRGDGAQLEAVRAMLRGAASIDIAAAVAADGTRTLPADGAPIAAGQATTFDVVVRNEGVGHRFPGGVLDAQDTWIQVEVRDAQGALLAQAGGDEEATGADASAHVLRAVQADDRGTPLLMRETQRFRATVYNHTIAPRDAEVERYRFDAPRELRARQLPLRITARLRHRSRNLALQGAVCAEARTARGVAFARQVRLRTDAQMDPCGPEPVTELATAEVSVGEGARALAAPGDPWRRLYVHGLGLLHAQQEDVDAARPSLERALELAPAEPRDRAMVLHAMAEMSIREGRTDEALERLQEAEALTPEEPAIAHARGEALAGIWRWKETAPLLQEAAMASPRDDAVWSHLAVAWGSADEPRAALEATSRGLQLTPRDADMLRVQALALESLGAAAEQVALAREAFARWRPPDEAPAVKNGCSRHLPWCALERLPIHVHVLRAPPAGR